jgi:hypothetical protein
MSRVLPMALLKPPPWTVIDLAPDDDGNKTLLAWVRQEIARPENKALRDKYLLFDNPKGAWADLGATIQSAAVKAARKIDPRPLDNLLDDKRERPRSVQDQRGIDRINQLGVRPLKPLLIYPETRIYLAELVRKEPKRRGPATHPNTQATRHATIRHVKLVEIILQRQYREQKQAQIRDRAIELVAAIQGMNSGTISNFFKKKPKAKPRT